MLDNIMVGRIGTDPMTGVSIVNSLLFVWNLCVFGGLSGIGIFTAQYCGKDDQEGVRHTFRLQILMSLLLTAAGIYIFMSHGQSLIGLYLHEDGGGGSVEATMQAALSYLTVMCFGFLPFAVTQAYNTTIRSHGETVAPMIATLIAVAVNLAGNYILIYGKLGAPALGVVGAAAATVTSRFVELAFIAVWAHTHAARIPFITGAYRSLYVPRVLTLNCIRRAQYRADTRQRIQRCLYRNGIGDGDHHRPKAGGVGRIAHKRAQKRSLETHALLLFFVHALLNVDDLSLLRFPENLQYNE